MPAAGKGWAALVPELAVTDLAASLAFYVGACGFHVRYVRPEDGFAYLDLGGAQLMLEVAANAWWTAAGERPLGRGVNLQIECTDVAGLAARLAVAGIAPFRPPATSWYREGAIEHGQAQVLVQDPDGYLLRFAQPLGTRPAAGRDRPS